MRLARGLAIALGILSFDAPAFAQKNAGELRYFTGLGDLLGDRAADVFVRENRQNGKVVSALLDVCYGVSPQADRKDRFAIDLKIDGNRFTGNGQTTEEKLPVSVDMTRKAVGKAFVFEGKIGLGTETFKFKSEDNSDISGKEFDDTQTGDQEIATAPANFTDVSPHVLGVRIDRKSLAAVVGGLRGQNVGIAFDSLSTDCAALRSGEQVVRFYVDPARSQAVLDSIRSNSGVKSVGWMPGLYDMERAVRFAASSWRQNEKIDREKIAATLSATLAKSLDAAPHAAKWNNITGEVTVAVRRLSQVVPALKLTETIEFSALIGPDRPGQTDRLVVWLGIPTSVTTDEQSGPRLEISSSANRDAEDTLNDDDAVVTALAAALNGQRWDSDKSQWK